MKFTPTTPGNYFDIKNDLEQFTRKLKIREVFWNSQDSDKSLVRQKSNKPINSKNEELKTIVRKIELLEPCETTVEDNLSTEERNALLELKNNTNIIIKPADKGNSIVIMNVDFYHNKLVMTDHLNTDAYKKVEAKSDIKVKEKLDDLIEKHLQCLTKNEINYCKTYECKTSELYVLPKVHKCKSILAKIPNNSGDVLHLVDPPDLNARPIIAGCTTPTRSLSEILEKILKPIVEKQKSYVKDDCD